MTWWQLYANVLAVAFPIVAVFGYLRSRRVSYLILLAQIGLFPTLAAIVFAINPGPQPQVTPLLALGFGVIVVDLIVIAWSLLRRRQLLANPISIAELDRFNDRAKLSRALTFLAVTMLVWNFEPWLGVASLVFFIASTTVWVPARWRRYSLEFATELAARPQVIFPFLVDPAKWSLYRSGEAKIVKVTPPGPLAAGSRIVTRIPVSPGKHIRPFTLETTSAVTELVEDSHFSTVWVDRPYERSRTQLEALPSGTRLVFRLDAVMPFWLAAMGVMPDIPGTIARRRDEMARNYARLNEILKATPAQ